MHLKESLGKAFKNNAVNMVNKDQVIYNKNKSLQNIRKLVRHFGSDLDRTIKGYEQRNMRMSVSDQEKAVNKGRIIALNEARDNLVKLLSMVVNIPIKMIGDGLVLPTEVYIIVKKRVIAYEREFDKYPAVGPLLNSGVLAIKAEYGKDQLIIIALLRTGNINEITRLPADIEVTATTHIMTVAETVKNILNRLIMFKED